MKGVNVPPPTEAGASCFSENSLKTEPPHGAAFPAGVFLFKEQNSLSCLHIVIFQLAFLITILQV